MRRRTKTLATVLTASLIAAAIVLGEPAKSAVAASTGAGYAGITPYGGYLGNYIAPDGMRVYCIDSGRDWPSGATDGGTVVGSLDTQWGAALSPTVIRKLNYALLNWGQTADPTNAAAVSAYIYAYLSNFAQYNGQGYAAGLHYINGNSAVLAAYNVVWNVSETNYAGPMYYGAKVTVDMANSTDGSVTVHANPANAKGTLTLSGAVVAKSGATSIPVSNGSVIPITGTPGAGASSYSVSASASFTADAGAQQNLVVYSTGSQQRTIRGAYTGSISFSSSGRSSEIPLRFAPVVETHVASDFVDRGAAFVDTVRADVAVGSAAWRRGADGDYLPIVARGTLYGPFTERPDVAAVAPADAPVVGRETLTLAGPGEYRSPGTVVAPGSGFFTWVWTIDAHDQSADAAALLPEDYTFADQFGLAAESAVSPMRVTAVSRVSASEIALGGAVTDELSVVLSDGAWLTSDGTPIPAVFEGIAYFVPGDVPPVPVDVVPDGAQVLGTASISADAPGIYPASSAVTAPAATAGYITWVWSLSRSSVTSGYFEPWADQFGLPAETTRVVPPTVATQAVQASAIGDEAVDTAMVGGVLPAEPAHLIFRAYLQESGTDATCDDTTLAFDSSANPVEVTAVGSYASPPAVFDEYGTYFWVESLVSRDGQLIHEGVCGLAEETTLVAPGVVTTQSTQQVLPGEPMHDTALVSGLVPEGASLTFQAFAQEGIDDGPLCDESTLAFTSDTVPVPGPGVYDSPAATETALGTYYWVETLADRNGEPLHVGGCGVKAETTLVTTSTLAMTGTPVVPPVLAATALIFAGIAMLTIAPLRRRRGNTSPTLRRYGNCE